MSFPPVNIHSLREGFSSEYMNFVIIDGFLYPSLTSIPSIEEAVLCDFIIIHNILKPLNAELNPICHFLAVLGAHPIFHVSRIRVNFQEAVQTYIHSIHENVSSDFINILTIYEAVSPEFINIHNF
jgi:hypothetical protein